MFEEPINVTDDAFEKAVLEVVTPETLVFALV